MSGELVSFKSNEIISKDKVQLVKDMIMKGASDPELELFVSNCNRTGLDPMNKQCWAVKRWDSALGREAYSFQTGVDGFRIVANRSGKYSGQLGPYWCGENGEWKDVWLSDKPPVAAKVGVIREDFKEPLWAVAKFSSYAARKKDGSLTPFWLKMPDLMIAKVAECLALRKAFPQDLSGVYSDTEMEQAETPKDVTPKQLPTTPLKEDSFVKTRVEAVLNHAKQVVVNEVQREIKEARSEQVEAAIVNHAENIKITSDQAAELRSFGFTKGYDLPALNYLIKQTTGHDKWGEITLEQLAEIKKFIKS